MYRHTTPRIKSRFGAIAATGVVLAVVTAAVPALASGDHAEASTLTPIKHLVVIFQENVSFDHYFATYPSAANTPRRATLHRGGWHARSQRAKRDTAGPEQPELRAALPARA